jgi:hypothetical protein
VPVIVNPDPATAAAGVVGAWSEATRKKKLEDQAQAWQQKVESRREMESDRGFGLDQGRAADEHQTQQSNLATAAVQRAMALDQQAFDKQMRPLQIQAQQATIKLQHGEAVTQQDQHAIAQVERKTKQFDLYLAKTYGEKSAQLGLSEQQARIAATNAGTALTQTETAHYGQGGGGGYGGRGGTRSELKQQAYDDAIEGLSDKGRQFMEMLYGTNLGGGANEDPIDNQHRAAHGTAPGRANPPTRAQAMMALGASGMNPTDKAALRTIIENRETQFETPGQQFTANRSEQRYDQRQTQSDARHQHSDVEQAYHDLSRGRTFNTLSPRLREIVRHAMVEQGVSVQGVLQAVPGSTLPDPDKKALIHALDGS